MSEQLLIMLYDQRYTLTSRLSLVQSCVRYWDERVREGGSVTLQHMAKIRLDMYVCMLWQIRADQRLIEKVIEEVINDRE